MEVMWIVLPLALVISALAVLVFIWAVRSGQFDDLVTPSLRVLVDDESPRSPSPCYAAPMSRPVPTIEANLDALLAQADIAALRSNLALSPAERMANLVAMNMFHARVQARTLTEPVRAALRGRDVEEARRRLEEAERERPAE